MKSELETIGVKGYDGRSDVYTAVKIQVAVFWVVTPCSITDVSGDHAASIFTSP